MSGLREQRAVRVRPYSVSSGGVVGDERCHGWSRTCRVAARHSAVESPPCRRSLDGQRFVSGSSPWVRSSVSCARGSLEFEPDRRKVAFVGIPAPLTVSTPASDVTRMAGDHRQSAKRECSGGEGFERTLERFAEFEFDDLTIVNVNFGILRKRQFLSRRNCHF